MTKETKVFGYDDVLISAMRHKDGDKFIWRRIIVVVPASEGMAAQSIQIWDKQVRELRDACNFVLSDKDDGS